MTVVVDKLFIIIFYFSPAAWQLTLSSPEKMTRSDGRELYDEMNKPEDDFCVLIFEPLLGSEYCVSFFGSFTSNDLKPL